MPNPPASELIIYMDFDAAQEAVSAAILELTHRKLKNAIEARLGYVLIDSSDFEEDRATVRAILHEVFGPQHVGEWSSIWAEAAPNRWGCKFFYKH